MENKGYLIYEVGNLGGNDKGEIKFILFLMFYEVKTPNRVIKNSKRKIKTTHLGNFQK